MLKGIKDPERLAQLADSFERAGDPTATAVTLKRLGKTYRDLSRFDEAIAAHTRGLECAQANADTVEVIRALNDIGTDFRRLGLMEEAARYHYRAVAVGEEFSDHDSEMAIKNRVISLNGIGNIYMTLGNHEAADSMFRAALEGERTLNSELGQAINYANLGAIMEARGEVDSARAYYQLSLEKNRLAGSDLGIALCHRSFGQLYENVGDLNRAEAEYDTAYHALLGSNDLWHRLEVMQSMARVSIKQGQLAKAQREIAAADSVATAIRSIEHQAGNEELKFELARARGDYKAALDHHLYARELADSTSGEDNINQIQNIRIGYLREHHQSELDVVNSNLDTERHLKHVFIFALILLGVLAAMAIAFLLYTLRVRRRGEQMLRQIEKMRTDFFTNITHEFRTPLTVILGLSDQLRNTPSAPAEQVHRQADTISRQGNNLLQLINQLLEISRVKSSIGDPDWRHGNVSAYVGMIVESYEELARSRNVKLSFASQQEDIEMDFAPYYLRRVVGNLLGNALKFTPEGGDIYVTLAPDNGQLSLTVADTGIGIAAKDLPHIFDPFYKGKAVANESMSTGVGLALVSRVVEAMGGDIVVHSEEGQGSVFVVKLPLTQGDGGWPALDHVEAPAPTDTTEPEVADEAVARLQRVLVVEDHADVARFVGEQLRNEFSVFYAPDGQQALERAAELVPDLIITDVMMPGIDGYELCRRVRADEVLNHIPLIILTALSTDEDRIKGYQAGADAYLVKPFNSAELRMLVGNLLDQRRHLRERYVVSTPTTLITETSTAVAQAARDCTDRAIESEQRFHKRFSELVMAGIERHDIDVEQIASELAMSSTQLRRKIRSMTGQTTAAYINALRMRLAATLLNDNPAMPVGDVADRCGYDDLAYFSRQFKQFYNVTPTQFRTSAGNG